MGSRLEPSDHQILSMGPRLFLFVFPLLGILLVFLFLLAEWAGPAAATAIVGETIVRYRHFVLALVLLLGIGHLISLFRYALQPLTRSWQSEATMQALLQAIPDTVLHIRRDGTYLMAKPATDVEWPFVPEELVGRKIADIAPPDLAQQFMKGIERTLQMGGAYRLEYERTLAGRTYYFESHGSSYDSESIIVVVRNITKRREAEAQVRYQAAIVKNLLDAVISVDMDFCILSWNPAAEKIYGWSAAEALGRSIADVLPCHWSDEEEAASKKALMEEGFWRGEVRQFHRDGRLLNILGSTSLFRNEEGTVTGAVSINRDVTEQKQAEQALRAIEVRNSALMEMIPDALMRTNRDGVFLDVSIPQDKGWPFTTAQVIGRPISDFVSAEQIERGLDAIRRVIESGEMECLEYDLPTATGTISVEARLVKSGENEALIISRDVTERRQQEEQLLYQAKLLASMSDVVFSVDNDSRILSWNAAAEQLYGWRADEVLGKFFLEVTSAEIVGGTLENFRQALAEHGTWSGEVVKSHRDGTRIDTLSSCDLIYDAHSEPTGILVVSRDITEKKRAERALRESEALNRAILAAIPDSLAIVSRDGTYLSMNLQQNINLGVSAEAFVGRRIGEVMKPEITQDALRIIHHVIEHDVAQDMEFRLPDREEDVYIEARLVKSGDDEVLIIARNVTERRKAEERLRFQAELLQNVSDAIVSTDMDLRIVSWNHAAEQLYGWREEEVVGRLFREVLNLEMLNEPREEALSRFMRDGFWQGEQIHQRRDGSKLTSLASISMLRDHEGNPTGTLGVNRDITERKEAELALQESEARFRAMVQHASEAIVLYDMDTHLPVEVNDHAVELFDLPRAELLQTSGSKLSAAIQPNGGECEAEARKLRRQLQEQGTLMYEWLYQANGREILAEVRAVTMPDRQRWLVRYSIVDVTERRRYEERLQQSQKLESLGLLAGGIAHDFNNLLTSILGQTSLAQHQIPPQHPARINMERATAAGISARALIQQMLAYAGRGQARVEVVNLNDVIRESTQLFKATLPAAILVETELDDALPPVDADAAQMQQLVVNFVLNAADAIAEREPQAARNGSSPDIPPMEKGRIQIQTTVRSIDESEISLFLSAKPLAPGRYVALSVQDNGIGMSPARLARIFDPFFSTKLAGTGLGLSVVMGIIKRHGGGLNVSSHLQRGTSFELLLPIAQQAFPIRQPVQSTPTSAAATGTVLIIDDEEVLRRTVRDILESVNITVLTAEDGYQGIDCVRERGDEIDLVLLDMRMPGLDGAQTLEVLREIDPALNVIISSGYSSSEQMARIEGAGPIEFIHKPYLADELISSVKQSLSRANHAAPASHASTA